MSSADAASDLRESPPYDPPVPYDRELADRIRELLEEEPDLTERAMFGGLAFLLGGHMAVAAGGGGDLLVRVDPAASPALVAATAAEPMVMQGRPMAGWLRVPSSDLASEEQLDDWDRLGAAVVRTLPPKRRP